MGCRKYKGEAFFDDLTGETHLAEELERMVFVFDGQAYEIDLTDENAEDFRAFMARYTGAARTTSKAKVLATLPKKQRHLSVVPSPAPEPAGSEQDAPETPKGQSVETPEEPKGTDIRETPSDVSDSVPVPEVRPQAPAPRPALSVVPPPPQRMPNVWAPHAPHTSDDKGTRVRKVRAWATLMGTPSEQLLTPDMFQQWEKFYREQGWLNL